MFIYNLIKSGANIQDILLLLLSFAVAGVFAIVSHEVSHGYVAKLNGDLTAEVNGRISFNPSVHFSPLGFLMLLLVGFGWAKPVPINPDNFKDYKKGMISVSLAGVIINIIIALVSILLLFLSYLTFFSVSTNDSQISHMILKFFIYLFRVSLHINVFLAFFNILPIYPLDGYNLVSTLLPYNSGNNYKMFMVRYGVYVLVGFIVFSNIMRALNIWYLDVFGMLASLIDKINLGLFEGAYKVIR